MKRVSIRREYEPLSVLAVWGGGGGDMFREAGKELQGMR